MRKFVLALGALGATALVVCLGACGSTETAAPPVDIDAGDGGVSPAPPAPPATPFKVGGTVTGLSGTGLVLQNNAGDSLAISESGAFAFALPLASGATFNVTVKDQPTAPAQTCAVSGGTGTVGTTDVKDVVVACTTGLPLHAGCFRRVALLLRAVMTMPAA